MELHEHTIKINNLPVHYWQSGEQNGRVILLIHSGFCNAHTSWAGIIPMMTDDYHVIAPDLPGFGKSAALPDDMQVGAIVEWIKAFLDALDIEQAVLVGSSISALYARLFAAAYPLYVPAVILVNGGTIPSIPPFFRALARLPIFGDMLYNSIARSTTSRKALNRMIYVKEVLTDELVSTAASNTHHFARLLRMTAAYPIPEKRIPPVPTMLLWGANDLEVPVEEAQHIQQQIPGTKLSEIEECGHFPQIETPEVFAWQVMQFLSDLDRPRKPMGGAGILPQAPDA